MALFKLLRLKRFTFRPLIPVPNVGCAAQVGYTRRMLICPVRGCQINLAREGGRLVCPRGHSFDVARSGYINLLQPQDRRSKQPGDARAAVEARRRLHDRGVTGPLLAAIGEMMEASSGEVVLDGGCREGYYLGTLARRFGFKAHGIDISIAAADAAARRYPECEWIVANADRLVPYADGSFSTVLSITGRMNEPEFRRVVQRGGKLLVAVAAPDDLIELRGRGRERVARTVETFAKNFKLQSQRRATNEAELEAEAVEDVLVSIYRPRREEAPRAMRVTFSLDLLLFRAV